MRADATILLLLYALYTYFSSVELHTRRVTIGTVWVINMAPGSANELIHLDVIIEDHLCSLLCYNRAEIVRRETP